MQLHCLAEPKLERESVVIMPSSCSSFDEGFLFWILVVMRMEADGSKMDSEDKNTKYIRIEYVSHLNPFFRSLWRIWISLNT